MISELFILRLGDLPFVRVRLSTSLYRVVVPSTYVIYRIILYSCNPTVEPFFVYF